MLLRIENEKTLPDGQRHKFNSWGEGAVWGPEGHNCFTWAKYHLKLLGIEFKEKKHVSLSGCIAACATDYTRKPEYYNTQELIQRI